MRILVVTLSHLLPQSHFHHLFFNMKQKITMKVQMHCQKCRAKALSVAAGTNGVDFVGLEGEEKEKVVVIGNGVDAAKLASCMRKKVGHTDIVSVGEVK